MDVTSSGAAPETTATVRTACSYCGVGCGMVVHTASPDGHPVIAKVSGDRLHPTNAGRLCTKGATHAEMMLGSGRIETAFHRTRRTDDPAPTTTDEAVRTVGRRLREILDAHGPDAISLYVSGQLGIEAQYLATKLAKGFIRTLHLESNSRLCMASAGSGYKQSLGADGPPGSYADFDAADVFLVIGSNMADCHPILFLRMCDRLKAGARLIVVDPRRTTTADRADLYLPIKPGTDLALLNGLLHLLVENGHIDRAFISEHTEGWAAMPDFLAAYTPAAVARITELPEADIRTAARWIGEAGEWMSCWTMGLNQSTHGTWNTNALVNLHLATGAICRPGSGPMSLTGQPNAMGGREMGYMGPGLPGQRVVLSPADRAFVEERWGLAPDTIRGEVGPGTVEMFRKMADGDIKACWIICTNPVASMANRRTVIAGLEAAEFVVTQDAFVDTATNAYADVMLPATLWAESDMVHVNSERTLTLLPQSIPPTGESLPDWALICRVATEMGFGADFGYTSAAEIFDEITGFWNPHTGWDLRGVNHQRLRRSPVQWPCPPGDSSDDGGQDAGRHPVRYLNDGVSQTLFVDADGHRPRLAFATPSRRAVFHPRPHLDPAEMPDDDYPFVLNTGRLQHQWHTMTKTGKVAKLNRLNPGPFVELHPDDAATLGVADGAPIEIASRRGRAVLPAVVTDRVRPGNCFAPFHFNDEHGEYLTINAVTSDAVDPVSLQPEFKFCAVTLRPVAVAAPTAVAPAESGNPSGAGLSASVTEVHPLAVLAGVGAPAVATVAPVTARAGQLYLGGFLAALQAAPVEAVPVLPDSAPVDAETRLWFDGMLAGFYSRLPAPVSPVAAPTDPTPARSTLVLWASQTGNAESFAETTARALGAAGLSADLVEMDDCTAETLTAAADILVVTSTFGDGGPPDHATGFWARLSAGDAPRLTTSRFAVLGFGDSAYDDFCGFARRIDGRLAELGARRVTDLVAVEPDADDAPGAWLAAVTTALTRSEAGDSPAVPFEARHPGPGTSPIGATLVRDRPLRAETPAAPAVFTRTNPIPGMLVRNTLLTGPGSAKEVRQLGFDLLDAPVGYEPGDALGVFPANDPATVARFLTLTGLDGAATVDLGGATTTLAEALRTHHDITRITPELLKFVAARHPHEALAKLLRPDNKVELSEFVWGRHVVDLLAAFPVAADSTEWRSALRKLQPRQYSISSSPLTEPREIQLTVSIVRYDSPHGGARGGLCSVFMADRSDEGPIPLYLQPSPHFRPPADPATPMIMVGPGTGIAPFRGFLRHRRAAGATGRNWLFFGEQHAAENFYYRTELEDLFREGFLTRLDLAFSRDQRQRIYVQDRMAEHGAEFWKWLADGAAVYVCGDAGRMARDVDATLLQIIQTHGKMTADDAVAYRKQLIKDGRYQRDVY